MGINMKNAEGYYDPTAYEAIRRIEEQAQAKISFRPVVYVCFHCPATSPAIRKKARRYCRSAVERGAIPLAPHLLFPQFMDDSKAEERSLAMFMDMVLLTKCAELWVFGENPSSGMKLEIEKAKRKGKPIRWFDEKCKEISK